MVIVIVIVIIIVLVIGLVIVIVIAIVTIRMMNVPSWSWSSTEARLRILGHELLASHDSPHACGYQDHEAALTGRHGDLSKPMTSERTFL